MKYFYPLLCCLFSIPFISSAQSNFKPGYIVQLNGDTVKGYINYKEWDKNPVQFSFSVNNDPNQTKNILVGQVSSFAVTGLEYYESRILRISTDPVELASVPKELDTITKADTVFLRVLTKGKSVSLFSYKDDIKTRYFMEDNSTGQTQELSYHRYFNPANDASLQTVNKFRTQLTFLAEKAGKNELGRQIAAANYTEEDLLKITIAINGSDGKATVNQFTPASNFGSRFFAGAGVTADKVSLPGAQSVIPPKTSVFPKVSLGFDFLPNKNTQQLYIRTELAFTAGKYNFLYTSNTVGSTETQTLNFSQYNVSLIPQLVWNLYHADQLKVFVSGGIAVTYSAYNNYELITNYDNISQTVQPKTPSFTSVHIAFPFKAGVQLNNKFEIYAEFVPASVMSDASSTAGKLTSYQAGFNYLFGVK